MTSEPIFLPLLEIIMFFTTPASVTSLLGFAAQKTAEALGCQNAEWFSGSEVRAAINLRTDVTSKRAGTLLDAFTKAYQDWGLIVINHDQRHAAGEEIYPLSAPEQKKYETACLARDTTRNALIAFNEDARAGAKVSWSIR